MNIQTEKLVLIEWIAKLNDSSVIEKVKIIHDEHVKSSNWWFNISGNEKEPLERELKVLEADKKKIDETAKLSYENSYKVE